MRLPTNLEEFRSSKLIKILAGGSAVAVSTMAAAQAFDGGPSPDVATIGLQNDVQGGDDDVKLDVEGITVSVPADVLLADGVDDSNDSPNDSPVGASNDSPDDSPLGAADDSPDDSPGAASNDSPDDSDGGGSADDS